MGKSTTSKNPSELEQDEFLKEEIELKNNPQRKAFAEAESEADGKKLVLCDYEGKLCFSAEILSIPAGFTPLEDHWGSFDEITENSSTFFEKKIQPIIEDITWDYGNLEYSGNSTYFLSWNASEPSIALWKRLKRDFERIGFSFKPKPKIKTFIMVEYDEKYTGGNYHGVGKFVFLPSNVPNIEEAFEKMTELSRVHIVKCNPDDLYNRYGGDRYLKKTTHKRNPHAD